MCQLQGNDVLAKERIKSLKKLLYCNLIFFSRSNVSVFCTYKIIAQVLISGFNIIGNIKYLENS